jgi:hypothetical protein
MPLHVAPLLRAREDALETAGLLVKLASQGLTNQKSLENAGGTFRESPKVTYLFNNTSFTPPQIPSGS